ncbi:MAG: Uncharacterized protein FD164_2043 [Nitrospirae bacterium]|nr:MAG: Uncharacterized protein FD164_2043 [Nitrospirota bacterium]
MIRKFNYTGRRKLPRANLSFQIHSEEDGVSSFWASLSLRGLQLPPDAEVFVEAYRGASSMRFSFGTVGNLGAPESTVLDQIQPGGIPLFRVKIVRDGRLIAAADRIVPHTAADDPKDRLCLLPVEFIDMGDIVWHLDLSEDHPVLQVNACIEGIRETVRTDSSFFSLVYPEIVRQVLRHILLAENYGDEECDPDDWQANWLRFAESLPGVSRPPSRTFSATRQDREFWIEDAVQAFCRKWRVRERFSGPAEEGG